VKAIILAGGFGTRLSEETALRPKPMVEIGGMPILWHIMKIYSAHGIDDVIVCCGYKGYVIKEYFANYFLHMSDVTFDMRSNEMRVHRKRAEPWTVTLVDTGEATMTGGRLLRVRHLVEEGERFCFTYGDGVADIDVAAEIAFHESHGKIATMAAVSPPGRFGALGMDGTRVTSFMEKPRGDGGLINGGFFVLDSRVFDYLQDDATTWEQEPLMRLASEGQLEAWVHRGFWQPMDTLRDRQHLEELWSKGQAPWRTWDKR
jgi:glucose-1-phosphate cytidylyltransferase